LEVVQNPNSSFIGEKSVEEDVQLNNSGKILIVDDHGIFRAGLKALLEMDGEFVVVADVNDGYQAVVLAAKYKPDLVIVDLSMPKCNGTEAIARIKQRCPDTKVLVLTVHKEEEYVRASLQSGADSYTLKDDTHEELFVAIRTTLSGKTYVSSAISKQIVSGYLDYSSGASKPKSSWELLTRREREVLKLVVEGMKNREIAVYLSLSTKTIEKHRANVMHKLKLGNMPALISYAIEHGIVA